MIVKDEEDRLDKCLTSVETFVDEIIIVDTGSLDKTKQTALNHKARVFDYNARTHPDSFILDKEIEGVPGDYTHTLFLADFAGARQYAFNQAKSDYIMWLDGDDWVENAENLKDLTLKMWCDNTALTFLPYDWALNKDGTTLATMDRERICKAKLAAWSGRIHECLMSQGSQLHSTVARIKQDRGNKVYAVKYRNYKVLLEQLRRERIEGKPGSRTLFYLGQEARGFNSDQMVKWLDEYCTIARWRHEKAIAHGYLGEYYEGRKEYGMAYLEYAAASVEDPNVYEGWFGLARTCYHLGRWGECAEFTERGFKVDRSKRLLTDNAHERECKPHYYYNVALSNLGRTKEALDSCLAGMVMDPKNVWLVTNKKTFEEILNGKNS